MKKADELRKEYRREDLGLGVRGKYYRDYMKGTNLVLLRPEVAQVFPTAEAVNDALQSLIEVATRVRMKYAAKLKFLADESFDEGSHIDQLLRSSHVAQDLSEE